MGQIGCARNQPGCQRKTWALSLRAVEAGDWGCGGDRNAASLRRSWALGIALLRSQQQRQGGEVGGDQEKAFLGKVVPELSLET